tara:strand:- start:508 stop:1434 length:927 start_codon:yes stop_codon:yes gene_type:complete
MARHLLISDGTTSTGVEANGAVGIEKLSATGPTQLVPGDTLSDSMQIRFVQGTATRNIYSPWIYGKDVVNFSGKSYSAPVAHTVAARAATTATATGEIVIKFVRTDGTTPEFFSFSVTPTSATSTIAQTAVDIETAYDALTNIPDWLNPDSADDGVDDCVFTGALRGDTCQSGNTWEYGPVTFNIIIESNGMTAQTITAVNNVTVAQPGYGDGFAVRAFEESQQGTSHGFYMRGHLPKQPTLASATATNYDMYSIVATKDGSSSSQINGVDNLIEISIAFVAGNADGLIFEGKLNPWMNSTGFSSVNL